MASVSINGVSKSFGATEVLRNVSVDVPDGSFMTLLGPSGCGKSTLLRVIAGLEAQDSGHVSIGAQAIDHLRPKERNVAMVFQSYALYPHMTVFANMAMPLVMQRLTLPQRLPVLGSVLPGVRGARRGVAADVHNVAQQLQIEPLLSRKPGQLSGGQRQRVALGRAMVRRPLVFLMDEPLSNLDAKLRVHMRTELSELHKRLGTTFIYVTHDQVEAMTMSDMVAVMADGEILQIGTPDKIYGEPESLAVAQFIGTPAINLLDASVVAGGCVALNGSKLPVRLPNAIGQTVTVGVRPEGLSLAELAHDPRHIRAFEANVRHRENLGPEHLIHLVPEGMPDTPLIMRLSASDYSKAAAAGAFGGPLSVTIDLDQMFVFGRGGERLRFDGDPAAAAVRSVVL